MSAISNLIFNAKKKYAASPLPARLDFRQYLDREYLPAPDDTYFVSTVQPSQYLNAPLLLQRRKGIVQLSPDTSRILGDKRSLDTLMNAALSRLTDTSVETGSRAAACEQIIVEEMYNFRKRYDFGTSTLQIDDIGRRMAIRDTGNYISIVHIDYSTAVMLIRIGGSNSSNNLITAGQRSVWPPLTLPLVLDKSKEIINQVAPLPVPVEPAIPVPVKGVDADLVRQPLFADDYLALREEYYIFIDMLSSQIAKKVEYISEEKILPVENSPLFNALKFQANLLAQLNQDKELNIYCASHHIDTKKKISFENQVITGIDSRNGNTVEIFRSNPHYPEKKGWPKIAQELLQLALPMPPSKRISLKEALKYHGFILALSGNKVRDVYAAVCNEMEQLSIEMIRSLQDCKDITALLTVDDNKKMLAVMRQHVTEIQTAMGFVSHSYGSSAEQLCDMLFSSEMISLSKKLLGSIDWYVRLDDVNDDRQTSPDILLKILLKALLLYFDPAVSHDIQIKNYFLSSSNLGRSYKDIYQQYQNIVADKRPFPAKLSMVMLILQPLVPEEFLVGDVYSGDYDDLTYGGSSAWVNFSYGVALSALILPGLSRRLTCRELMELPATLERMVEELPATDEQTALKSYLAQIAIKPIIIWAQNCGILPVKETNTYSQAERERAAERYASYVTSLPAAMNTLATLFNRADMARETLRQWAGNNVAVAARLGDLETFMLTKDVPNVHSSTYVSTSRIERPLIDFVISGKISAPDFASWSPVKAISAPDLALLKTIPDDVSAKFEKQYRDKRDDQKLAYGTYIAGLLLTLPVADQIAIRFGKVTLFAVRDSFSGNTEQETLSSQRGAIQNAKRKDAVRARQGVIIKTEHAGTTIYFEVFPLADLIVRRIDISPFNDGGVIHRVTSLSSGIPVDGGFISRLTGHSTAPHSTSTLQVIERHKEKVKIDLLAYQTGSKPRPGVESDVIMDKMGAEFPAYATESGYLHHRFDQIGSVVLGDLFYLTDEQWLVLARGETPFDQDDRARTTQINFLKNFVPFWSTLENLDLGKVDVVNQLAQFLGLSLDFLPFVGPIKRLLSGAVKIGIVAEKLAVKSTASYFVTRVPLLLTGKLATVNPLIAVATLYKIRKKEIALLINKYHSTQNYALPVKRIPANPDRSVVLTLSNGQAARVIEDGDRLYRIDQRYKRAYGPHLAYPAGGRKLPAIPSISTVPPAMPGPSRFVEKQLVLFSDLHLNKSLEGWDFIDVDNMGLTNNYLGAHKVAISTHGSAQTGKLTISNTERVDPIYSDGIPSYRITRVSHQEVTPEEFVNTLKNSYGVDLKNPRDAYGGGPIYLLACGAGRGGEQSIAQKMANVTGRKVVAYEQIKIWVQNLDVLNLPSSIPTVPRSWYPYADASLLNAAGDVMVPPKSFLPISAVRL